MSHMARNMIQGCRTPENSKIITWFCSISGLEHRRNLRRRRHSKTTAFSELWKQDECSSARLFTIIIANNNNSTGGKKLTGSQKCERKKNVRDWLNHACRNISWTNYDSACIHKHIPIIQLSCIFMHLTAARASFPDWRGWCGARIPAKGCIIAAGETERVTFQSKESRPKQLGSS